MQIIKQTISGYAVITGNFDGKSLGYVMGAPRGEELMGVVSTIL